MNGELKIVAIMFRRHGNGYGKIGHGPDHFRDHSMGHQAGDRVAGLCRADQKRPRKEVVCSASAAKTPHTVAR
jgi:hypothetical protein